MPSLDVNQQTVPMHEGHAMKQIYKSEVATIGSIAKPNLEQYLESEKEVNENVSKIGSHNSEAKSVS